ncbi:SDR family NAD(P)-dependent oxidoreductase [Rhodoferax antarcticus]|uniref:Short chain dehydrogenase family protein n=1 Tax=Rhodoferax antarcticus ANT.BR TaxID=1111071 RepID=A0A1Q8YF85_9BURK|nr:SDR family NAD(P)-dependent oxidoreductase [Rhodoferax antarcticus]APW48295.1 hypothetical protein RA876_07960 [Rhodoferax antarcticus]MCW2312956.1 gluconate 5-dehydrogenase [Rhodoferax antarcticus]OLP06540.1 short chain dehydrogenase family protein [Rhodoferax antarcticus ANT.BR]
MPRTIHQLFDLTGKTALIAGGSRGVGLQMAYALGEAGARLMLFARQEDALEAACAGLQAAGLDARWVAADGTLEADLQKLVSETLQRMGEIDILVNNAGVTCAAPVQDQPVEVGDKLSTPNLHSMALLSQLVGTHSMIGRGGYIINLACNTSQDDVITFTRTLAGEWGKHHIQVNAILANGGDGEALKGVTVLLASDAGKRITGQCLVVDGGASVGLPG